MSEVNALTSKKFAIETKKLGFGYYNKKKQ